MLSALPSFLQGQVRAPSHGVGPAWSPLDVRTEWGGTDKRKSSIRVLTQAVALSAQLLSAPQETVHNGESETILEQ